MAAITAAVIGGVASAVGTGVGMYSANKDRKNAQRAANGLKGEIDFIEGNRQEIINPFEGVSDLSSMATNLSGNITDLSKMASDLSGLITDTSGVISNPMANLAVSTAAAEMQAEEADIALANTLDTLAATGASAGGATALAQAALQSKKGVATTIEQQEKANADKAARGEERLQNAKQAEAQRLQMAQFGEGQRLQDVRMRGAERVENAQMSEAQRLQAFQINQAEKMQDVGVKSELFQFNQQEKRTMQQLDRLSSQLTGQLHKQSQASANKSNILSSGIGSVGSIAGSYFGSL
tara:strand:- start:3985 stop:4869 length:885 start_codon:yes stop_codon:yes gene_type:complete